MAIRIETGSDRISVITIDNPSRRNALDEAMFTALAEAWTALEADSRTRVVLVRGNQEGGFCSGADLSAGLHKLPHIDDLVSAALLKTRIFPKPIVAAVNGDAVAGGLELALAADIRIVDQDAKIGFPEVRWGIFPAGGAALKLADQVGYAAAMDLLLTGRLIDGREAVRIGLMTDAVRSSDVETVAYARAASIAENSPLAVRSVKEFVAEGRAQFYVEREARERELVRALRASPDLEIGVAAFLARTRPDYGTG